MAYSGKKNQPSNSGLKRRKKITGFLVTTDFETNYNNEPEIKQKP